MYELAREWLLSFGKKYGVNPLVFAIIYFGAIPFFFAAVAWIVKNARAGRSFTLPMLLAGLLFISPYLYLMVAGHDVPWWVYAFIAALLIFSAVSTFRKIRAKVRQEMNARSREGR